MDKIIKPGKVLTGFKANNKGTSDLEIGPRYHSIILECIATAAAGQTLVLADFLGLITVLVNGKPQRIHLATELDAIQTSYGTHFLANIWNYDTGVINYVSGVPQVAQVAKQTICYLQIWFAEPWRKSWAAAEQFAWYTAWKNGAVLKSFQLEVTGGPTTHLLAGTDIVCNTYVEYDAALGPVDASGNPVAFVNKWYRNSLPYGGAGDLQVTSVAKKDALLELRMFCQAGDDIGKVTYKVNGKVIRQVTKGQNDVTLISREFNPTGLNVDRFDLIFDYSDLITDASVLSAGGVSVQDLDIVANVTTAAAANKIITVLAQKYGTFD